MKAHEGAGEEIAAENGCLKMMGTLTCSTQAYPRGKLDIREKMTLTQHSGCMAVQQGVGGWMGGSALAR